MTLSSASRPSRRLAILAALGALTLGGVARAQEPPPPFRQTGTPSSVSMTLSGGVAPYIYAWERVSGGSATTAGNASGPSTPWSKSLTAVIDSTFTSIWRGKITDSAGQVAYTPNVAVTIEYQIE